MRVLLVNKLYYPVIGGVETHVRDLARFLPQTVERKVLVASEKKRRYVGEIDGVEVVKAYNPFFISSSPVPPFFRSELKRLEPWADLFHFHFPFPPGEISFIYAGIKKPLVVTYHSDIVRQKTMLKLYKPYLERFLDRADAIIATSPNYVNTSPFLSPRSDKCRVVPLGIDPDELRLSNEEKRRVEDVRREVKPPIILFVGRLIYYKGAGYLIRAMKDVDASLIIVGKGPLEPELKALTESLGLSQRVYFYPHLTYRDLVVMYHACDVFCLPSVARSEAFGIVQLEAQACGKPVVSTELGTGTSFANLDGATGFVVPPADPEALADALNRLVNDESLRQKLGQQARERVSREFTVKAMIEGVLRVYQEVLS